MPAPTINPSVSQLVQFGMESVSSPGAVAATKRLQTLLIDTGPMTDGQDVKASGASFPVGRMLGKEWGQHKLSGTGSYNELPYFFSALINNSPTITPVSPGATRWQWNGVAFTPETLQPITIEKGTSAFAEQWPASQLQAGGIKLDRSKYDLSGTFLSKALNTSFSAVTSLNDVNQVWTLSITGAPTGGSFTVALGAGPTVTIPYNSTAAAAQPLLDAQYPGQFIATGGPLPATPLVLTAAGSLAGGSQSNLTVVSGGLTGGTTPAASSTVTTAGAVVTPDPAGGQPVVLSPASFNLYAATYPSGLGLAANQLAEGFEFDWQLQDRFKPVWRLNSSDNGTYQTSTVSASKGTFEVVLQRDSYSIGLFTQLRANTQVFFRFAATGPSVDGTNNYSLTIDTCVNLSDPKGLKDEDGIYAIPWDGIIAASSGWGNRYCQVTLVNALTAL